MKTTFFLLAFVSFTLLSCSDNSAHITNEETAVKFEVKGFVDEIEVLTATEEFKYFLQSDEFQNLPTSGNKDRVYIVQNEDSFFYFFEGEGCLIFVGGGEPENSNIQFLNDGKARFSVLPSEPLVAIMDLQTLKTFSSDYYSEKAGKFFFDIVSEYTEFALPFLGSPTFYIPNELTPASALLLDAELNDEGLNLIGTTI